jgi:hypothetical protein
MTHFWIIERKDCYGRSWYLRQMRPDKWSMEQREAIHFDDTEVLRAVNWLVCSGVSHSLVQSTSP